MSKTGETYANKDRYDTSPGYGDETTICRLAADIRGVRNYLHCGLSNSVGRLLGNRRLFDLLTTTNSI